ncbi:uncharacterized protein LOC105181417 [Harpegnathos saltator]|uniref:uncharacterized protein LOC105181417 n=1 Tax=Harpegnathos saltator TaxID=610380 RepID=UPI00058CF936|nr:uncharacterized protein LOC105181417 [Harpegnathos saltator]
MINLDEYTERIRLIRQYALDHNVSEIQTTDIFRTCFQQLETKYSRKPSTLANLLKLSCLLIFASFILLTLCSQKWLSDILVRLCQNSIYPSLYILRKVAVPVMSLYPSLSELYDEWCLIENPYFYVNDMDCLACTVVYSVPDLTGHNISKSFNVGIPYTKAENNTEIKMNDLVNIYWNNYDIFDQDAEKIISNNESFKTIHDIMVDRLDMYPTNSLTTHILWKINRMKPNRILRRLFPKPTEIPNWWSQGIEKFVFIDESKSPSYVLPSPECSNIVIRCTAGARLIRMMPSSECIQHCRSSTILLSAGHTLWYNWWYWRPVSLPVYNATDLSISYLTSFC